MKKIYLIIIIILLTTTIFAEAPVSVEFTTEAGFIGILKHDIQSGSDADKGDVFNYLTQGNQDTLFPFYRYQADFEIGKRHHVVFLYQPINIQTQAEITAPFRYKFDDYNTTDGFINLKYGFDFWRFSYLFDIIEPPDFYLSAGLSLQIRNASIVFKASESGKGSIQDNIGPVPIIKLRSGYSWKNKLFIEFDGDGFYASSEIFNGAAYPFVGYIYDLSIRVGYRFNRLSTGFLNLRSLGGGALGTNNLGEYTSNDLHTLGATLGLRLHL